jgi:membrane protease YdiL (CAAX protease family)
VKTDRSRLAIALQIFVVWALITVFGSGLYAGFGMMLWATPLQGINPAFAMAIIFLAGMVFYNRWRDIGFARPTDLGILWLPFVYIGFLSVVMFSSGLPSPQIILLVFYNTLLVGISEELMFRGIRFQAMRGRFAIWPSIWLTTALFGSVHVMNAFLTGHLLIAIAQTVTAFFNGILFLAIRQRTGSLYPAMAFHALWNLCIFLKTLSPSDGDTLGLVALATGFVIVLPNLLYGLYLLRNVSDDTT